MTTIPLSTTLQKLLSPAKRQKQTRPHVPVRSEPAITLSQGADDADSDEHEEASRHVDEHLVVRIVCAVH
eukprot:7118615-Prymnesium_polylepis.1